VKNNNRIAKSLVWLVVAGILPVLAYSAGMAWILVDRQKVAAEAELSSISRALSVAVDAELLNKLASLEVLAADDSLDTDNLPAFQDRARRMVAAQPAWRAIALVDPTSKDIVASSLGGSKLPRPTVVPDGVDMAVKSRQPLIYGVIARGNLMIEPGIMLICPVLRDGKARFVITAVLVVPALNNVLLAQRLPSSWTGAVVDPRMRLAGRSRDPDKFVGRLATPSLVDHIAAADSGLFEAFNLEGDKTYTVFARSPATGWSVVIGLPAGEFEAPGRRIQMVVAATGGGLIVLGLVLAWVVGRWIVRRQREHEGALWESRENYRRLIESVRDYAIIRISPDGLVDSWNTVAEAITGYKAEDILGRSVSCFYPPEDRDAGKPQMVLDLARQQGRCEEIGWRMRADGTRYWANVVMSAIYNDAGEITGFSRVLRDLSDRRALEEERRRLSIAIEQCPVSVVITDATGAIEYVNAAFTTVTGYSRDDALGQNPRILKSGETTDQEYREMWAALTSGKPWATTFRNRRKDGSYYWENAQISPVIDIDGQITHFVGVKENVTERRLAQERLETLLAEQRAMLENQLVGIAKVCDRRFIWANPAFEKMLGYGPGELLDVSSRQVYPSEEAFEEIGGKAYPALARGQIFRTQAEYQRKDGRRVWLDVAGAMLEPGQGVSLWGFIDITQTVKLEQDLQRTNADLEQFAYVASHDLRQPLRMVSSYLQLIEKKLGGHLDQDLQSYLGFAVDGAKRMDRLIIDLLQYSRTGRTADFVAVPLNDPVADALFNLTVLSREANVTLSVAEGLPTVAGDPAELCRLFQNLIGNAIKYRSPDRPPVVEVGSGGQADQVVVWVKDNGIGIAPEHHERVFQVFQRLVSRGDYEGTGIGLAVCKKIIEHHGGRIWIESEPGSGSTFFMSFPPPSSRR